MSKSKNKKNQRIKKLKVVTGLLICCCIILTILLCNKLLNKNIYKVENRTKNIVEEKKKDPTGVETFGWLRVQGTNIDTPIIKYTDSTIQNTNPKEKFLWNINKEEKIFNKVTIMGHNIMNLSSNPLVGKEYFSRFEDLMSFVYPSFVEENKYIQYTINNENYVYKVFAVLFAKQYKLDVHSNTNYSEEKLKEYIDFVKKESIYDFNVSVNETDKIISLVTCTRLFGSNTNKEFVVVGRLVRNNERLTNYKFEPNSNYKKIEKIMEGDKNEKA